MNQWYLSVEVPTSTMGEKDCQDNNNCECLAESMLHDLDPINVHGALYLKTFTGSNQSMPASNCLRPTPNFLAFFFEKFQSERTHKNKPYAQPYDALKPDPVSVYLKFYK